MLTKIWSGSSFHFYGLHCKEMCVTFLIYFDLSSRKQISWLQVFRYFWINVSMFNSYEYFIPNRDIYCKTITVYSLKSVFCCLPYQGRGQRSFLITWKRLSQCLFSKILKKVIILAYFSSISFAKFYIWTMDYFPILVYLGPDLQMWGPFQRTFFFIFFFTSIKCLPEILFTTDFYRMPFLQILQILFKIYWNFSANFFCHSLEKFLNVTWNFAKNYILNSGRK